MSNTNKERKYLSPEDQEDAVYSSGKSHLHREAVRDDFDASMKQNVTLQHGFTEDQPQPFHIPGKETPDDSPARTLGSFRPLPQRHINREKQHYPTGNDSRTVIAKSAGSIPAASYGSAERYSHINDAEHPVTPEPGTSFVGDTSGVRIIPETADVFKPENRAVFSASVNENQLNIQNKQEYQVSPEIGIVAAGVVERTPENPLRHTPTNRESQSAPSTPYSSAERINDAEDPGTHEKSVRYGTVEHDSPNATLVSGAAGAVSVSGSAGVFKTENRIVFAASVNEPAENSIRDSLKAPEKASEAAAFRDRTWGSSAGEKKGLFRTAARIAGREIEATIGQGGRNGDIDDRAKGTAAKYGYQAGKYAALSGAVLGRETYRMARYGKKLSSDVAAGVLTNKVAKKLFTDQLRTSLAGSGTALSGIIKDGVVYTIEDFKGSDDLGMQAITKPKDILVGAKRTLTMAKSTGRTVKRTFTRTKTVVSKATEGVKAIAAATKSMLTNPLVIKGIGMLAPVIVIAAAIISVISCVVGIIPSISLKSEDYELSQTYLYITELDARMEEDIITEDTRPHTPEIDEYHYYLNGLEVTKSEMEIYTNADLVLAYLDSKYEDYSFDGIIAGLFGTTVKGEVQRIHEQLHQVAKSTWTETIEWEEEITDPVTGETVTVPMEVDIYHMDISLTTKSWEEYFAEHTNTLLTEDQQEMYDSLQEVGIYTFRQQLSSPFIGTDWSTFVSSRWGWRIHPISGELKQHLGLDISMPGGTPINACNSGTIQTGSDPDGLGNFVRVIMDNGDYTLYGHMSTIAVTAGQTVSAGDVIGYVGTTGVSTGNHLHLEYCQDGRILNPLIFTECA